MKTDSKANPPRTISTPDDPAAAGERLTAGLIGVLEQVREFVSCLTDAQYVEVPAGFASSAGGHVRHCLDHVRALALVNADGRLDYDRRDRGTPEETDRRSALLALSAAIGVVRAFDPTHFDRSIRVTLLPNAAGPPVEVLSSVARECAFVLSHTIHHNAVLLAMAARWGVSLPAHFGYAPATVAHLTAGNFKAEPVQAAVECRSASRAAVPTAPDGHAQPLASV